MLLVISSEKIFQMTTHTSWSRHGQPPTNAKPDDKLDLYTAGRRCGDLIIILFTNWFRMFR